jgi:predicted histone-like DNA-binding protein
MPIFYNKVERSSNPNNPAASKKFYPVLKSTGMVREREIAKLLADETTLNPKEAEMAVSQLFKVATSLLINGTTVQLGSLGSFRLTATTEASDTLEEVNAKKNKKLNVRFTESEDLKNALKNAKFIDTASLSNN